MTDKCSNCGSDWRGPPIPVEDQEMFGGQTHFSRRIGIEDSDYYDGIAWWLCPDCGLLEKRWPWVPDYDGDLEEIKERMGVKK